MPRGYYIGQGLIPLGYSSSDDEEGPCKLPNGRIVCGPHGLVVCNRCCTDYSDNNEDDLDDEFVFSDDDNTEEHKKDEQPDEGHRHPGPCVDLGPNKVKGTGKVLPSKFVPSSSNKSPLVEFSNHWRYIGILR